MNILLCIPKHAVTDIKGSKEDGSIHSPLVAYASMLGLLSSCPPFVIFLWFTMVHMDGSASQFWDFCKQQGNVPVYKVNGVAAYFITLITYIAIWWFGLFNPAIVYDHLGEIFSALIIGSFIFCILLYIKGHVAPSSTDSGSSGDAIIDFYWGMELYPRIGKSFDIKVFTNCRFGMMSWAVLAVTYCIK